MRRLTIPLLALGISTVALAVGGAGCSGSDAGGPLQPAGASGSGGSGATSTGGTGASGGSGGTSLGGSSGVGGGTHDAGWPDAGNDCLSGEQKPCYTGPVGTDGVGLCVTGNMTCQGGVWSECGAEVVPTAEVCNGQDDDCDGLADEEMGQTTCGQGICEVTVENCVAGHPEACTPKTGNATEQCDGADDNCDGQVDEGCTCLTGQTQSCYTGDPATKDVGECKGGIQTCSASGAWGTCANEVKPVAEKCNGLDDDCDGQLDEGNPQGGQACSTGKPGVCAAGTTACSSANVICNQTVQPSPEVCDGADNNCNGQVDDGNPEGGQVCNTGKPGICGPGTTQCQGGAVACIQNKQPATEICDTIDNDCDNSVDEGCNCVNGQTQACYTGPAGTQNVGICKGGTQTCTNGNWGACVGQVVPGTETCDGSDNDCDGATDEGNPGGGASCSTGLFGICSIGTLTCQAATLACIQNQQSTTEICNNSLDDDCDGQPDEGCVVGSCSHDKCVSGGPLLASCNACTGQICAVDPYCCNTGWDSICIGRVRTTCNSLICPEAQGSCPHSPCVIGTAMSGGCDGSQANCVSAVCNKDSYCCTNSWDSLCVGQVSSVCGKTCT